MLRVLFHKLYSQKPCETVHYKKRIDCEGVVTAVCASQGCRPRMEDTSVPLADILLLSQKAQTDRWYQDRWNLSQRLDCLVPKHRHKYKSTDDWHPLMIFDGHGGANVARFLTHAVPHKLSSEFRKSDLDTLKETLIKIEKHMMNEMSKISLNLQGSTATMTWYNTKQEILVVAQIGDSMAMIRDVNGARYLTRAHKPCELDEKKRIEAAGGSVICINGIDRVNGSLAVSRAYGDILYNECVTCEPDISIFDMKSIWPSNRDIDDLWYVLVASDGLWDVTTPSNVDSLIQKNWKLKREQRNSTLKTIIEDIALNIIDMALILGTKDNVTVGILTHRKQSVII